MIKLAVILEPSEDGGYTVTIPTVPGCISEGETVEEAMENIIDALGCLLEPVEDDLIVHESFLVKELILEVRRDASREASPSNGPASGLASGRAGRAIELE